jgi:hypothetical protein
VGKCRNGERGGENLLSTTGEEKGSEGESPRALRWRHFTERSDVDHREGSQTLRVRLPGAKGKGPWTLNESLVRRRVDLSKDAEGQESLSEAFMDRGRSRPSPWE